MKYQIKRGINKGHILIIHQDEFYQDDNELFCGWALYHKRYNLRNNTDIDASDYDGWEHFKKNLDAVVILPVYMYDHSGVTISTVPYACPYDSGQLGFVYYTRQMIKEMFGWKRVTKARRQTLETYLDNEVRVYDSILRGEVYGYEIQDQDGNDIDSCWGFVGEPNKSCMAD